MTRSLFQALVGWSLVVAQALPASAEPPRSIELDLRRTIAVQGREDARFPPLAEASIWPSASSDASETGCVA
jgi:hypothetical protein